MIQLDHELIEPIAYALADLDNIELYDKSLQRLLHLLETSIEHANIQTSLLVYRAIGLKKDKRYIGVLRKLLYEPESDKRGVVALALARINGVQELDTLKKAYAESGSSIERVMIGLGLIEIGSPESIEFISRLRKDLTVDSYFFIRHFKDDIISILRKSQEPLALLLLIRGSQFITSLSRLGRFRVMWKSFLFDQFA